MFGSPTIGTGVDKIGIPEPISLTGIDPPTFWATLGVHPSRLETCPAILADKVLDTTFVSPLADARFPVPLRASPVRVALRLALLTGRTAKGIAARSHEYRSTIPTGNVPFLANHDTILLTAEDCIIVAYVMSSVQEVGRLQSATTETP